MIDKLVIDPKEYEGKLIYAKGKNVKQIAEENNADIAFGFSFVDYKGSGVLYGETYIDGKKIFSDIPKTVKRSGFGILNGVPYIGQYKEGSSSFSKAGPLLVSNSKDVRAQQIKIEQIQSDVADSKRDRIGIGLRDGLITVLYTKGDITLGELTKKALEEKLEVFNNGDGGESVTVYIKGQGVINRTGYLRPVGHAWVFVKKGTPKKPYIALDDGHGMETAGKRTPKLLDGSIMHENEFNKAVLGYLKENLLACQFDVLEVAPTDEDTPLTKRTDLANEKKVDLYLSIHANAYGKGDWNDVRGIETFVHKSYSKSVKIAEVIHKWVMQGTSMPDRGIKDGSHLHVCRETKMSAVLVELGFMTNKEDVSLLLSDNYRIECANELTQALCEVYNKEYVPIVRDSLPSIDGIANIKYYGKSLKGYLTSEGRSVAEVRQLCEMLGYKVEWDSKTNTVEIKLP